MSQFPLLYTDFAKYYDLLEGQYREYDKESQWLRRLVDSNNAKLILDISCGTGRHLEGLVKVDDDVDYVGMDASPQMVSITKKKLSARNQTQTLVADFLSTPFRNEAFDFVICMYWSLAGLNHSQASKLFANVSRVLKYDGIFVFDVENADGIKENLLNRPFIDAFFEDQVTNLFVTRVNFSRKIESDLVDWQSYYLMLDQRDRPARMVEDRMNLRFYSQSTLKSMLEECNLSVLDLSSSPEGNYYEGSPSLYFVTRKKESVKTNSS